jgi:hypothetical protein
LAVGEQPVNQVAANETGGAGDENLLHDRSKFNHSCHQERVFLTADQGRSGLTPWNHWHNFSG